MQRQGTIRMVGNYNQSMRSQVIEAAPPAGETDEQRAARLEQRRQREA